MKKKCTTADDQPKMAWSNRADCFEFKAVEGWTRDLHWSLDDITRHIQQNILEELKGQIIFMRSRERADMLQAIVDLIKNIQGSFRPAPFAAECAGDNLGELFAEHIEEWEAAVKLAGDHKVNHELLFGE